MNSNFLLKYEKQIIWGGIAFGFLALWYFGYFLSILTFLVIFSLLIILHELGHFWAARKGGVQVEEFGFGLPPKIWEKKTTKELVYMDAHGVQKKRTETMGWTLNAVPIGGFVRMLGEDETEKSESPHAFGNRPLGWRILIVCGGVIMNFLLGFFLLTGGYIFGINPIAPTSQQIQEYSERGFLEKAQGVVIESIAGTPAETLGFQRFDIIREIDGRTTPNVRFYSAIADSMALQEKKQSAMITIDRFNSSDRKFEKVKIEIPLSSTQSFFFPSSLQTKIISVIEGGKAEKVGLKAGDRIMMIDNIFIRDTQHFLSVIEEKKQASASQVHLSVRRSLNTQNEVFVVPFDKDGYLGVHLTDALLEPTEKGIPVIYDGDFYVPVRAVRESLWNAPVVALQESWRFIGLSINMVRELAVKIMTKFALPDGIGGPVSIAHTTGMLVDQGDFSKLVQFTAILSLSLAVINIMPFPALDGGRLLFLLVEAFLVLSQIIGKKLGYTGKIPSKIPPTWEAPLHLGGYILLLLLIAIISWQDIVRIFFS